MFRIFNILFVLQSLSGISAVLSSSRIINTNNVYFPHIMKRDTSNARFDSDSIPDFELYTRENPTKPQYLQLDDETSLNSSNIEFGKSTIIFFHGFLESSSSDDSVQIRNNYLKYRDVNVILANNKWQSMFNAVQVGIYSAKFIDFLVGMGLKLSDLHIIGMSLGGQIAGITGKNVKSGKVSRITGLDPAGGIFTILPESERIGKGDAEFVDIVHTNAGLNGMSLKSGDVDIWVNGGSFQPGCSFLEVNRRKPGSIYETLFCSHFQAYRMYVMSLINGTAYPITKCSTYRDYLDGDCEPNNVTYLGVDIETSSMGNYYIQTGVTAVDI